MTASTAEIVANVLGITAGVFLACSTVPQIYRIHKRDRATDLSGSRQVWKINFIFEMAAVTV